MPVVPPALVLLYFCSLIGNLCPVYMKIKCTYGWHHHQTWQHDVLVLHKIILFVKLWHPEAVFMDFIDPCVRRVNLCKKNSLQLNYKLKIFDSWSFQATAGSQLLGEPCRPSRKACWEAGRHARRIDPPVASCCLFTNNKSMQRPAGGRHAWPLVCWEHSHILHTFTV